MVDKISKTNLPNRNNIYPRSKFVVDIFYSIKLKYRYYSVDSLMITIFVAIHIHIKFDSLITVNKAIHTNTTLIVI